MIEEFFERLIARFQADAATFPDALANFNSVADFFGNIWLHFSVLALVVVAGFYLFSESMERYLMKRVMNGRRADIYTDLGIFSVIVGLVMVNGW